MRMATLMAIAALAATPAVAQELTPGQQLQFANGLYARGLHRAALVEYRAVVKNHPDVEGLDAAYFRMAECALQLGDKIAAAKAYKRVYSDFPDSEFHHRAGYRRAGIFFDETQYEAAAELFAELIEKKPPDAILAAALYMHGSALEKIGKNKAAAAQFARVIKEFSDSDFYSYSLLARAEALKKEGQIEAALELYSEAAQKAGADRVGAEAWFQLADQLFRLERFEKSAHAFATLLEQYPDDPRAGDGRLQAAWAFHNAGMHTESLAQIAKVSLDDLDDLEGAQWLYVKANSQRQLLKHDEAVQTYAALLKRYPQSSYASVAGYEKALVHYRKGDYTEAIQMAKPHVKNPDLAPDVLWLLAESHAALNQDDESIQSYRRLVDKHPDHRLAADALYRVANRLQKREQFLEAAKQYRRLVEDYPTNAMAAQSLFAAGFCLAREGKHAQAVRDWSDLIKTHPDDAIAETAHYQKAMSEIHLKRDDAAAKTLTEFIGTYPKSKHLAGAHFWNGVMLSENERPDEAARHLRKAMQLAEDPDLKQKATFHLGHVLHGLEKFDEAVTLLQGLLDTSLKSRFSPGMLEWMANHHMQKQQYDKALDAAAQIVKVTDDPNWLQSGWVLAGRAYMARDKADEARDAFTKALAQEARTEYAPEAALRLGDLLYRADDCAAAEEFYTQAADAATADTQLGIRAAAFAGMGRAAQCDNRPETAVRYFLIVALLFDDDEIVPDSLCRAIASYKALARAEERKKTEDELLERFPDYKCPTF